MNAGPRKSAARTLRTANTILVSLFQQDVFSMIGCLAAFFFYLFGALLTLGRPERLLSGDRLPLTLFLFALMIVELVLAAFLARLAECDHTRLFPHYRRFHLVVLGIVLLVAVALPAVLTAARGLSPLVSLALFLGCTAIIMWLFHFWGDRSIILMLPLMRLVYEVLGLNTELEVFGSISRLTLFGSKIPIALLIILFSLVALVFLVKHSGRPYERRFLLRNGFKRDSTTRYYDRMDAVTAPFVDRGMRRLLRENKTKPAGTSFRGLVRLFRVSLFSPGYAFTTPRSLDFLAGDISRGLLFLYFLYVVESIDNLTAVIYFIFIMFYLVGPISLALDFFLHRGILPQLWLQSASGSRREFTRALFYAYLVAALQRYLLVSLCCFVIILAAPGPTFAGFLQVMPLGIPMFAFWIGLSLLFNRHVGSGQAKGWVIASALVIVAIFAFMALLYFLFDIFSYGKTAAWAIEAGFTVLAGIFLRRGYLELGNTELDFPSPENSSSEL